MCDHECDRAGRENVQCIHGVKDAQPICENTFYISLTSVFIQVPGKKSETGAGDAPARTLSGPYVVGKVQFGMSSIRQVSCTVDDWEAAVAHGAYPKSFDALLGGGVMKWGTRIEYVSFAVDCCAGGVFHGYVTPYLLTMLSTCQDLLHASFHNACFYKSEQYRCTPKPTYAWKFSVDSWEKMAVEGRVPAFAHNAQPREPFETATVDKVIVVSDLMIIREEVPSTAERWVMNAIACLGELYIPDESGEMAKNAVVHPAAVNFLEAFSRECPLDLRITFSSDGFPVRAARGVWEARSLHKAGRLRINRLEIRGIDAQFCCDVNCWRYVLKDFDDALPMCVSHAQTGSCEDDWESYKNNKIAEIAAAVGGNVTVEAYCDPSAMHQSNVLVVADPVEAHLRRQNLIAYRYGEMYHFKKGFAKMHGVDPSRVVFHYRDYLLDDDDSAISVGMPDEVMIQVELKGGHDHPLPLSEGRGRSGRS